MLNNLTGIQRISYYAAPAQVKITPYTIPVGVECVEVLTSGRVFFEVDGSEREYGRGTVFWHTSGDKTICKTTLSCPYRCVVYIFTVKKKNRYAPRVSVWKNPEEAAVFSENSLKFFHGGITDKELFASYTYSTMLWNSLRQHANHPWPAVLQLAVEYIKDNWNEAIDADDVAKNCGISKPYLFALFREHLKTSPHKYVLAYRISSAKFMLANTGDSIKSIAISCGFASLEVFYRQFKGQVKITPAEYRKNSMPYSFIEANHRGASSVEA